ncbi:tRNA (adenosine(37)-N6)-threonylcarbamoyltransferase complex dimerization subunit type 1 TsaB [Alkalibacillus aidingensis]|uniref:tRNA (adenosine(37)-N6)-threonylcarbamoyltransferase complex dimerization subunit type 1 TsaB n=1 Tax=Alkalibacillus aidingensis TaxID=2747607 RepID=UPI0016610387|nr:tRNA (adenosine(37)-N6)-threonylcarbamoyltransferase complex dimerization subunit type 1 TsaB [Alkalibacillus aidingensis]
MNVLAIDTSNQPMSVSIIKESTLAAELTVNVKRNHSLQLMPAIDHLFNQTGLQPNQLDKIAIAAGPGSYTGLRIGMTTAKTMAWGLNIPIVSLSSLELLASNLLYDSCLVSPFFDARRGNVYTGLYRVHHGDIDQVEPDQNIDMTSWLEYLKSLGEYVKLISSTEHGFQSMVSEKLGDQGILVGHSLQLPRAGLLGSLAINKEDEDVHGLKPNYHRLVEAEAKWMEQQQKDS